jgi:hypothetical protein
MNARESLEQWAHRLSLPVKRFGRMVEHRADHAYDLSQTARRMGPGWSAVLDWWGHDCDPPPPNARKRQLLHETLSFHQLKVAIETGTFLGDTTAFLADRCDRVITIELDPGLAARARERFKSRTNVTVLEGDSGEQLPDVLAGVDEPALFWLDGHFSGFHEGVQTARGKTDTPLRSELETIVAWSLAPSSVILIDDARMLGLPDYPTFAEIREMVRPLGDPSVAIICDSVVIQPYRVVPEGYVLH